MKQGFTLIELLAVIVILAIIALIAVPIVVNIIDDSKKESLQRSIDLYIEHAQKAITKYQMTHPGFNPSTCEIKGKLNLDCNGTPIEVEMKGQVPESGTITIVDNKLYYDVVLEGMEYVLNEDGKKDPVVYVPPILATDEDYRGYYADVDGDGNPDGVIYADLGANIEYPQSGQWVDSNGTYTYNKATGELNEYTISKEKYTGEKAKFGEKEIIKLKKNKDNPRFYVMALEDFTTEAYTTYYWYKEAYGDMDPLITLNDFGQGKENTQKMIAKWNAAGTAEGYPNSPQNNLDIWKHIKDKYNSKEKWYIPSRGEWAAFGDYFTNKTDLETKLTTSNYDSIYGLSGWYWSSSQEYAYRAWYAGFLSGSMYFYDVNFNFYVRLGVTF